MTLWAALALLLAILLPAGVFLRPILIRLVWWVAPPFRAGNVVTIGDCRGTVEKLGWFAVRLRNRAGDWVAIPNAVVFGQTVIQSVASSGSQDLELRFPVPPGRDPEQAREAVQAAVHLSPCLALDRPMVVSLEEDVAGGVAVQVRAGVFDASLRVLFETSVIEVFHAYLDRTGT